MKPTLVLVGAEDEIFYADRYEALLGTYNKALVRIVPESNHDGLQTSPIAYELTADWLKRMISNKSS